MVAERFPQKLQEESETTMYWTQHAMSVTTAQHWEEGGGGIPCQQLLSDHWEILERTSATTPPHFMIMGAFRPVPSLYAFNTVSIRWSRPPLG